MTGFDIQGARKAGYSDGEIADLLSQKKGFDLQGARNAGYSDTEIADKLAGYEKPGVVEDVAKSVLGKGLPTAIASKVGGIAGDLGNLAALGGGLAAKGLWNAFSDKPLTPEQESLIYRKPFYGSEDIAKNVAKMAGTELYEPQTRAGKMADTVTQFTLGNPGKKLFDAAQVVPAVASEGLGQAYEGTPYEAAARIGGALVGGQVGNAGNYIRNTGKRQLAKAAGDIKPEAYAMAEELMNRSYNMGTPLTGAEAIAQVTGDSKSPLLTLQRIAEQSPETAPTMSKFFAGRPGANSAAFKDEIRGMGQQVGSPYEIAPRVQNVAEGQIKQAERLRTDATRDYFTQGASESVPAENIQQLINDIDQQISKIGPNTESAAPLRQLRSKLLQQQDPEAVQPSNVLDMYGVPMSGGNDAAKAAVPETNIGRLQTAYKETRDKLDALPLDPNSIQRTARGTVGPINQRLAEVLDTNPNVNQGNQLYSKISQEAVDPLKRSPVGQLAETDDLTKQLNTLFGSNPPVGSEGGVSDAISRISQQDPEAARSLVAQHLEKTFNEATQKLTSGENQWGAAKFSSVVRGNSQQHKNLEAAIKSLPGGDDINAGFNRMMEVFDAQGKRLQAGSPTAQNTKYMNVMGAKVNLSAPLHTVQEMVDQFRYGRNLKQIADTLTDPNSVEKLKELAKLPADSPKAARIIEQMMGPARAYGQTEGQQQEEYQAPMPSPQQAAPQTVAPQAIVKPSDIKSQIADISQQFGNDPQLMQRIAGVESNLDPKAKAKTSTARGLYQFTKGTWDNMVNKYGKQYGIGIQDREDPKKVKEHAIMANLLMKDNAQALEKTLGRTPNGVELYMAHFLGAPGASKMLSNLGQQIAAADVNPEAANANKAIFYKNGRPLTPQGVYNVLAQKIGGA